MHHFSHLLQSLPLFFFFSSYYHYSSCNYSPPFFTLLLSIISHLIVTILSTLPFHFFVLLLPVIPHLIITIPPTFLLFLSTSFFFLFLFFFYIFVITSSTHLSSIRFMLCLYKKKIKKKICNFAFGLCVLVFWCVSQFLITCSFSPSHGFA